MRAKGLHLYLLVMSQLCYYYINPHFTKIKIKIIVTQEEFESPKIILKELRLNRSTTGPLKQYNVKCLMYNYSKSLVQVSHLLKPITKRLHYFYANQALLR